MSTYKHTFSPAKDEHGLSRLIFKGSRRELGGHYIWLIFDLIGLVKDTTAEALIMVPPISYQPDNTLGKTLAAMGFKPELKTSPNGLKQVDCSVADLEKSINEFLTTKKQSTYAAVVTEMRGGKSWFINVDTLEFLYDDETLLGQLPNEPEKL